MESTLEQKINEAAVFIKNAKYAVAFTGAGSSTRSGIPDFRSKDSGLWEKYDPYQVASLSAFRKHPKKFYEWIKPLFFQSQNAKPNNSHIALAALEKAEFIRSIITQNIDGLHQRAGSKYVIELHGTALTATCSKCATTYDTEDLMRLYLDKNKIPICKNCERTVKPDVILFEEMLPIEAWEMAYDEINKADLVLVVGSSLEVYPANTLPEMAVRNGAKLIINTLSPTPLDLISNLVINADVCEVLPKIASLIIN